MLCAEVHCQAYRGDGARTTRTDEAVRATRGEALFGADGPALVDAVYSAMCGGHGEDNDAVWGNAAEREPARASRPAASRSGRAGTAGSPGRRSLRAFLARPGRRLVPRAGRAGRDRFRWERTLQRRRARCGGRAARRRARARDLESRARGVSGRARVLAVEGERGRAEIAGELRIRRLLGDLPSAMFVVDRDARRRSCCAAADGGTARGCASGARWAAPRRGRATARSSGRTTGAEAG